MIQMELSSFLLLSSDLFVNIKKYLFKSTFFMLIFLSYELNNNYDYALVTFTKEESWIQIIKTD